MVLAVDFDGTITKENNYPNIGELRIDFINYLIGHRKAGNKVILWTCRINDTLEDAVKACKKYGLEFDAVNDNLPEVKEKFGVDSRKIFADWYIDDRAVNIDDMLKTMN